MDTSMYNPDELVTPTWMDTEFLETILKSAKNGDVKKILEYNIGPASVKTDHIASIMFRAIIQYLDNSNVKQEISLIIKAMPEVEGTKKDLINDSIIFENEIEIFRDVIPKFEEMLKSIGDNTIFGAKMFYYALKPRKIIVLEDIKKLGYSTISQRMCTMEEATMALEKLAKWHACSYVLNQETNGSLEKLVNGIYKVPGLYTTEMFYKGSERLAEVARKIPKLQKYADKLDQIKDKVMPKLRKIYDLCEKKGRVNVLLHGDFHAKNLMFKTNPQTQLSEDVMLVDFQMSVWSSMALDLLYFIYLTIDFSVREAHFNKLIYEFFCKFRDALRQLGYNGKLPTYTDLQLDMLTIRRLEVYLVANFLPWMVSFVENPHIGFDEIITKVDDQMNLYYSQMYIDIVEPILERFLNRGYFENIIEDDTEF